MKCSVCQNDDSRVICPACLIKLATLVPNETERATILSGWSMDSIADLINGKRPAPQMSDNWFAGYADKFGAD